LPYDATAEEVEELLTRCGVSPVLRVHLPIGPDGRPRGFGFVTLSNADAVQQSLGALSSADLRGRRVMVKVAHPRGTTAPGAPMRTGAAPMRTAPRPLQSDGAAPARFDGGRVEAPGENNHHRAAQGSVEFEEDEEGARAAAGKVKEKKRKGVAAAAKRKGATDESRRRGGASSWQRWEDWDED
jgi:RNA recognition motif-containing protein